MSKVYTVCCDENGCYWQASCLAPENLGIYIAEHIGHNYFSVYVECE